MVSILNSIDIMQKLNNKLTLKYIRYVCIWILWKINYLNKETCVCVSACMYFGIYTLVHYSVFLQEKYIAHTLNKKILSYIIYNVQIKSLTYILWYW